MALSGDVFARGALALVVAVAKSPPGLSGGRLSDRSNQTVRPVRPSGVAERAHSTAENAAPVTL